MIDENGWVLCPKCNGKTRIKVDKGTIIKDFILFCPKCKAKHKVNIENLTMVIPDKCCE